MIRMLTERKVYVEWGGGAPGYYIFHTLHLILSVEVKVTEKSDGNFLLCHDLFETV
jgi:hypothetical protein